jgi:hypothetical protein
MGVEATLDVESNGFFPDVVGSVTLEIKALKGSLLPFDLTERGGDLQHIDIYVASTEGTAAEMYKEKFKPSLTNYLQDYKLIFHEDAPSKVPQKSKSDTLALSAVLRYPKETLLHTSILVESNN